MVKEVPVPREEPPVEAAYQLIVPADAVAPNATVPALHREAGVVPEMEGEELTVIELTTLDIVFFSTTRNAYVPEAVEGIVAVT